MKRATLIVLFLAALFVIGISMLFRGCNRPSVGAVDDSSYRFGLHASITPVPEPAAYALWAVGFIILVILKRKL